MMQQTANNDDIFLCYDRDERRDSGGQHSGPNQGPRVIKPPNQNTGFSGASMQKKFPSQVLGNPEK
jgi:hypothetical protein